jgi:UDPglucose--hexose-1-phosphate uridylyltransferase
MPELRREPIVGRWVAIQSEPGARPEDFEKEDLTPRKQETCPFCAGKEHLTPPEVLATRSGDTKPIRRDGR